MLKHYYNGVLQTTAVLLDDERGISAAAVIGQVDMSTIYVQDPDGTRDYVPYKVWKMVEDACPAGNQVVWHGYVWDTAISRKAGAGYQIGSVARIWEIELIEDNGWPSRQVIIAASADRPAETVSARITWVLTMRGMTGIIYDHGLVEACTTALDATDYRNRTAKDVLDDCALLSGYNWFVRYREVSDDIELIFQAPTSTADPASLTISNVNPNLTTEWPPNDEARQEFGASRIASGILLPYDGGTDYDQDLATAATFGTVDQTAPTAAVKTKTKARAQITRLLAQHNEQDVSIEGVRLFLPAANLNDVKQGQYISSAKFSHFKAPYAVGHAARVKSRAFGRPENRTQAFYDVDLSLSPALGYLVCDATDALGNPITNTTDGFYAPLLATAPTSRVDGLIAYVRPGLVYPKKPHPSYAGAWSFPEYNSGGVDYAGDCTESTALCFAVGAGTMVIHTSPYGAVARALLWRLYYEDSPADALVSSGSGVAGDDFTIVVPDDGHCIHWVQIGDTGGVCGSKWGFVGFNWTRLLT